MINAMFNSFPSIPNMIYHLLGGSSYLASGLSRRWLLTAGVMTYMHTWGETPILDDLPRFIAMFILKIGSMAVGVSAPIIIMVKNPLLVAVSRW